MRYLRYFLLLLILPTWLLCTNSGLNTIIGVAKPFLPMLDSYSKPSGSIFGKPITFENICIKQNGNILSFNNLILDWQRKLVVSNKAEITTDKGKTANIDFFRINSNKSFDMLDIIVSGKYQAEPLLLNMKMQRKPSWQPKTIDGYISGIKIKVKSNNDKISAKIASEYFSATLYGKLEKHTLDANINYKNQQIKVSGTGKFANNIWQSQNLLISSLDQKITGIGFYNSDKQNGKLSLNGKLFDLNTNVKINVNKSKLSGKILMATNDISRIMSIVPQMTRLKGEFNLQADIKGSLTSPIITSKSNIRNITATFPSLGVKIKPMEITCISDANFKLVIDATGQMRYGSGDFKIKGYIDPLKPNMPNNFSLVAKKLEFVNNEQANLTASTDLKFNYNAQENIINIKGDIIAEDGFVNLNKSYSSNTISNDVVFIGEKQNNHLKYNPIIFLRIEDKVRFNGFSIDGNISGKLDIYQRSGTTYADGRITIKQGQYSLGGQKLQIDRGRLLYPAGSLISNPLLDIKLQSVTAEGLDLLVQGSAQAPLIKERSINGNQDRALSQVITTSSEMIGGSILQGKIQLPSISLNPSDEQSDNFFAKPNNKGASIKDKDLVVGMPIGKKLYLQYLQSLDEVNNNAQTNNRRVKLKYHLNKYWFLGLEAGEQGKGADIGFSIER